MLPSFTVNIEELPQKVSVLLCAKVYRSVEVLGYSPNIVCHTFTANGINQFECLLCHCYLVLKAVGVPIAPTLFILCVVEVGFNYLCCQSSYVGM